MVKELKEMDAIEDPDEWDITALQSQLRATNGDFTEP